MIAHNLCSPEGRNDYICIFQVAEILKDRPTWFRDCRAVEVLNVLPTANGGTIELLYMQVMIIIIYTFYLFVVVNINKVYELAILVICANYFGPRS